MLLRHRVRSTGFPGTVDGSLENLNADGANETVNAGVTAATDEARKADDVCGAAGGANEADDAGVGAREADDDADGCVTSDTYFPPGANTDRSCSCADVGRLENVNPIDEAAGVACAGGANENVEVCGAAAAEAREATVERSVCLFVTIPSVLHSVSISTS
jgi:hypothetical protein